MFKYFAASTTLPQTAPNEAHPLGPTSDKIGPESGAQGSDVDELFCVRLRTSRHTPSAAPSRSAGSARNKQIQHIQEPK